MIGKARQQTIYGSDAGNHIVSLSGGKDSSAMLLRMLDEGMEVDRVMFFDTGLEFEGIYKQVEEFDKYLRSWNIELEWLTPPTTWDDHFFGGITRSVLHPERIGQPRGWPLSMENAGCWWRRDCKEKLARMHTRPHDTTYIGIATNEAHRAKQYNLGARQEYPLISKFKMAEPECLDYIKKVDFYEPVHLDFKRTGCFLCPKQPLDSLRTIYHKYPRYWMRMLEYEKRLPPYKCGESTMAIFRPGTTLAELDERFREGR